MSTEEERCPEPNPWVPSRLAFFLHLFPFLFWRSPLAARSLSAVRHCQEPTDIDQIVCDDAQAHPPLHASVSPITTAIQSMAPFEHADATFCSGSPPLASAEGALLLAPSSFGTLRGAVRNRDLPHGHLLQFGFIVRGVERCVASYQLWHTSELLFMLVHCWHQQLRVRRPAYRTLRSG